MIYCVYNIFLSLGLLVVAPVVPLLFLFGARFRRGFLQRIGFYPRKVRDALRGSQPIWIHAASVGEVLSAKFLVVGLKTRFPGRKVLLSTFTLTGNDVARQNGCWDAVIFLPLDYPWVVRRSLKLLDPSVLVFLETEIWPNLLREAYRRGIPSLLLSGRLSARAHRKYSRLRSFFRQVVRQFSAVGMQTEEDVERIVSLGVDPKKVALTGNLKHSAEHEQVGGNRDTDMDRARAPGRNRRVLVVGSTHRGEEEILLEVFLFLKKSFADLLMILAPRHPERFQEVERLLKKKGVAYEKKSQMNGRVETLADVVFLDTLGDLPSLYSMADVAFVGGSLVAVGGHNILEPARHRKPVLFGPHMANFMEVAESMKREGGGIEVRSKEDLIREIGVLLGDREKAKNVGEIAYSVIIRGRGTVDRSIDLAMRYL